MVSGYDMFRILMNQIGPRRISCEMRQTSSSPTRPHVLKNPYSMIHQATSNFRTMTRIAMTGTPLSNAVEEYHSMINWVAPNYLADPKEFTAFYRSPNQEGLLRGQHARREAERDVKTQSAEGYGGPQSPPGDDFGSQGRTTKQGRIRPLPPSNRPTNRGLPTLL